MYKHACKCLFWSKQQINEFWNHSSGEWKWLAEKPLPLASLSRNLWRVAVPSKSFYTLLFLSTVISTFGLLANSAATIIGAMIVAPLMGPIIAIAYGAVSGNRRLLRRASLTLVSGILICAIASFSISRLVGLNTFGSEIMGRVNPTLIDLGVAIAAGAAGAFAKSRRSVADALPGVAIAVALVPPLSVVGIGLAQGSFDISWGATLLFITNLIGIIFSGAIVFLLNGYGTLSRAKGGLAVSMVMLIGLAIPLGFSLRNLVIKQQVRDSIITLIRRRTITFSRSDIQAISVIPKNDILHVSLEVSAPANSINQRQINLVRTFLEKELDHKISLKVQVVPMDVFESLHN